MHRLVLFAAIFLLSVTTGRASDERPNVLFIAVDDLRPELGCYGNQHMHTPNIDRLAARGTVFERAYCMVPTCGASRASLMTGLRPARNRFVNWLASAEKDAPGTTTLNTHFNNHGYHTVSNGKVFHDPQDNAHGWSEPAWRPGISAIGYHLPENQKLHDQRQKQGPRFRGPAWEAADAPEDGYWDGLLTTRALNDMRRLADQNQPFFLAVGFFNPHLPFVAPQKYWDLYDREQIDLPETYRRPQNAPAEAIHNWGELRAYAGIPASEPLSDEQARTLIHGYYACVSHIDAQIGKLLDELDRLELNQNTLVVLWGDHGWNLGEHTLWCKHSCFETSMHAPLIVAAPGFTANQTTKGLTEFIDIYPSLSELAGLPLPDHLQGQSFVPLLKDPQRPWKPAAIGRYRNGDTIRTDKYRFTQYTDAGGGALARMLYDHENDPQEDVNISEKEENQSIVERLMQRLHTEMGRDRSP